MSKPIIRHCRNCEYAKKWVMYDTVDCEVKYKSIWNFQQRWAALFCRHFKAKGSDE